MTKPIVSTRRRAERLVTKGGSESVFGVIAAWSVLDLAAGRTLRGKVRVAIPDLLMPRHKRVANEAARVVQLVRLKILLEAKRARSGL